jgi:formate dehydrogenase major subunit
METLTDYINRVAAKPLRSTSVNFLGANYKRFMVSTLKGFYGGAATAENDFAYSWIP